MSELLYGIALGITLALIGGLYAVARLVLRRLDALRVEIAAARIEGLFKLPPQGDGGGGPTPIIRRRRRHLGVVSAIAGATVASMAWVREHRGAAMGLAASAALVTAVPLVLDNGAPGTGPAAPRPTSTVTASLPPAAPDMTTATVTAWPHSPAPSALPPARDMSRATSAVVALPAPSRPGPTGAPQLPPLRSTPPAAPQPTASSPAPSQSVPPGRDPHCLRLEREALVDVGLCVSL